MLEEEKSREQSSGSYPDEAKDINTTQLSFGCLTPQ